MNSSIDRHPDRDAIANELLRGIDFRTIIANHPNPRISLGALSRFRAALREEMGLALKARSDDERAENGKSLINRVEELIDEAKDICRLAKQDKAYAAATNALNSVARALELIGKLTGEIALPTNAPGIHFHRTTINNVSVNADDLHEIAVLVGEATENFSIDEFMRLKALAQGDTEKLLCSTSLAPNAENPA
jgi:hypothetical protein